MKKFTLTILAAAAILLCMTPSSQAGPGVRFNVVIGGPAYPAYYPPPYYAPYYRYYTPRVYWHRGYYYRNYRRWR